MAGGGPCRSRFQQQMKAVLVAAASSPAPQPSFTAAAGGRPAPLAAAATAAATDSRTGESRQQVESAPVVSPAAGVSAATAGGVRTPPSPGGHQRFRLRVGFVPAPLHAAEAQYARQQQQQLLIRVHAAGVNRMDILQKLGKYPVPSFASPILGVEAAGVVVATLPTDSAAAPLHPSSSSSTSDSAVESAAAGPTVAADSPAAAAADSPDAAAAVLPRVYRPGDRVMTLLSAGGCYAEYVAAEADFCLPIPSNLSFIEAAAIPENWITAYQLLFFVARLAPRLSFRALPSSHSSSSPPSSGSSKEDSSGSGSSEAIKRSSSCGEEEGDFPWFDEGSSCGAAVLPRRRVRAALVHAAASGVGTALLQLCAHAGISTIIATAGSEEKLRLCKSLGATHALNRREDVDGTFGEKVLQITGGRCALLPTAAAVATRESPPAAGL